MTLTRNDLIIYGIMFLGGIIFIAFAKHKYPED